MLHRIIHPPGRGPIPFFDFFRPWLDFVEAWVAEQPLPNVWRDTLAQIYQQEIDRGYAVEDRQLLNRVGRLCGRVSDDSWPLVPGDAWSTIALTDLAVAQNPTYWRAILNHASTLTSAKPGRKWRQQGGDLVEQIRCDIFIDSFIRWAALIGQPGATQHRVGWTEHTDPTLMHARNADCMRGLIWLAAADPRTAPTLRDLVVTCCRKVRGQLRCELVASAAIRALGAMPGEAGLVQLAQLELLIRAPKPRKLILKTIQEAAERENLSLDAVQEAAVPDLGLVDGVIRLNFGDHVATITPENDKARIQWHRPDGKTSRGICPTLKQSRPDAAEQVKATAKQLETILPAQRSRLERLMKGNRDWAVARWSRCYLDHPLVATITRRLIWDIDSTPALWHDGAMRNIDGHEAPVAGDVRLWHPLGRDPDHVLAWRTRVESLGVTQPFKQAHREIYLLTDAERNTRTYSNRFAAHILRNTTLVALCQTRGWISGLFGGQTSPRLDLSDFGVRAEFWAEPAGDEYTDFGAPIYVATDQVRFYPLTTDDAARLGHEGSLVDPLSLERVPPMALTEAMRDVDLFVGVASVGNDATWVDRGEGDPHYGYWQHYAFGELGTTALTRRAVLEKLLPRLKIADKCELLDRFLRVAGTKRAYKIHLGSGNILMEPNDQYLCIVPGRGATEGKGTDGVFLPFEGDRTLAIILSKAFLLAADDKINDPSILSQIRRG